MSDDSHFLSRVNTKLEAKIFMKNTKNYKANRYSQYKIVQYTFSKKKYHYVDAVIIDGYISNVLFPIEQLSSIWK